MRVGSSTLFFGGFVHTYMLQVKVSQILNGAADASWSGHYLILSICKVAPKNEHFEVDSQTGEIFAFLVCSRYLLANI